MELVNTTPLAGRLDVAPFASQATGGTTRVGVLLAKATFRWDERGEVTLDTQAPEPLLMADEAHPLGIVPRDDLAAGADAFEETTDDEAFELAVLACAHAQDGVPTSRMNVTVALAGRRSELEVFGDRVWVGEGSDARPSEPEPFATMSLGPERAFGGGLEVEIDEESFVPVSDPRNPHGRGLDPSSYVKGLAEALRCPEPFPRWERLRRLPNVEHPERLVGGWSDSPDPAGWSPWPISSPLVERHGRVDPGLCFEREPSERRLTLGGLTRAGLLELDVPRLSLLADAAMSERRATRAVPCIRWVLRVEERTLTATYRLRFSLRSWSETQERSMRLRLG